MKNKLRIYLNIFMAIIIIIAWLNMFLGANSIFASRGISSLKYFTVLSNLFVAFTCIIWVLDKSDKHITSLLKYISCVSVMITFLTVIFFLGPIFGYKFMFVGSNLWFHLLIPITTLLEFIFLDKQKYGNKDKLYTMLPLLIYGTGYLLNIIINGVGSWPNTNDWYGFMRWGIPIGAIIYIILLLINYLVASLLLKLKRK